MIQQTLHEIRVIHYGVSVYLYHPISTAKTESFWEEPGNEFKGKRYCYGAEPVGAKTKSPASTVDSI